MSLSREPRAETQLCLGMEKSHTLHAGTRALPALHRPYADTPTLPPTTHPPHPTHKSKGSRLYDMWQYLSCAYGKHLPDLRQGPHRKCRQQG